jgi:hypothetical protein
MHLVGDLFECMMMHGLGSPKNERVYGVGCSRHSPNLIALNFFMSGRDVKCL